MRKEIIDLRMSIEELEDLPLYRWKELLWERRREVKRELKYLQEASEFLEIATAEDLRKRALNYKAITQRRIKADNRVKHWTRKEEQSEEGKEKEKIEKDSIDG